MIAPLRLPEPSTRPPDRRLREAHEYIAETFLHSPPVETGPAVSGWKAWAFVAWVLVTTGAFVASMAGWF
ncbi:MAG: hypothetical protein JW818_03805 [Pirellulales bacterium]|nr:hypothetical protein [Pirellulales bacterium]